MPVLKYISQQLIGRRNLLQDIHDVIIKSDRTVIATIEPMMGKEMILYKVSGTMKYALSSVQKHISLHLMPIYASPILHSKYKALLPLASFQKGCINFKSAEEIPSNILKQLLEDCAKIDLNKIREDYLQSKKNAKK